MGERAMGTARLTVGEGIAQARRTLEAAGVAEARREAAELYAALTRRATGAAWLDRTEPLAPALAAALEEAARRRAAGWPQAYATGVANFRGHWLHVDRRVLIPRPETEGLVDLVLPWVRREGARRGARVVVADACTGSGAIAVAVALEAAPAAVRVIATDCSAEALAAARRNVEALDVGDRVELRHGDLLQPLGGERVDVVVSNPPYVTADEWERLEASVRDYEPRDALVGGPDGLAAIRELAATAGAALRPGGLLALEVDAQRAEASADVVAAAGFDGCEVLEDLFDRPRYVRARRPADGSH
jgi:release factor glutamine methyltransferase